MTSGKECEKWMYKKQWWKNNYLFIHVFTCMTTNYTNSRHSLSCFCRFFCFLPAKRYRNQSLQCCITFARGHRKTAGNLCRYSRLLTECGVCTISEKWPPARRFDVPAANLMRSPDPARSCCLTWLIARNRTFTTHRMLSVMTEQLIFTDYFKIFAVRSYFFNFLSSKHSNVTGM